VTVADRPDIRGNAELPTQVIPVHRPPGARHRIRGKGWIGGAVVIVTLAAVVLVSPAVRRELELSFVRQPAGFTELYFVEPRTEPVRTKDGRQQVAVTFAIANRGEAEDQSYTYRVQAVGPDGRTIAERTEPIVIPIDERRDVNVLLDLPATGRWAVVDVTLLGRPERIHDAAPIGDGP
jgi:hypothetical protein